VSKTQRLAIVSVLLAAVVGLVVFTAMAFIRSQPETIDFAVGHGPSKPVDLTVQTVGTIGFGVHPTWVSYLVENPQGKWVHTTMWQLPAHTKINVTLYEYDGPTTLRNQQLAVVTGVQNATVNGKAFSLYGNTTGMGVAHTFSVPQLGINVPLPGAGPASKLCGAAPCPLSSPHNVVRFSFMTPGTGTYRWQCFIPCGLGYLYGNGGPMSTIGWMGGYLEVN
jgi:hypothetical protein